MTYPERCKQAEKTVAGDVWRHIKTGKQLTILRPLSMYSVEVMHESGRVTRKQTHYLAGDYELVKKE